jgi:hypothetical protein
MSPRSCNSPTTTGEEAARTNGRSNSGFKGKGKSSRRARCRGSGRRATKHRLNGLWAANTNYNNNKMKHEEILGMMERRSYERRKKRVTDEEIKQWLEEEEYEEWNSFEMDKLEAELSGKTPIVEDRSFGSIPIPNNSTRRGFQGYEHPTE